MNVRDHLEDNHEQIMTEAREYAKNYGVSFSEALRDVRDEYVQGFCDGMAASRTNDWDYGQE